MATTTTTTKRNEHIRRFACSGLSCMSAAFCKCINNFIVQYSL